MAVGRAALGAAALVAAAAGMAKADSLGGIAANESAYVVGAARVCTPVQVVGVRAEGTPACATKPADVVAGLSTRLPSPERGARAALVATAKGRSLVVEKGDGGTLINWLSPDPISSVVDVWRSPTGRLVVVEYVVRRAGRELHDVVGFTVVPLPQDPPGPADRPRVDPPTVDPGPAAPPPVASPALTKAVAAARKARGKAALKAWTSVLALDDGHPEALYRLALAEVGRKQVAAGLARLEALAGSTRPDAIEWLVAARFERGFAKLLGEPRFRAAVGFDRPAATVYERVMGFGGQWEQPLTPCDQPEIKLVLGRDRGFALTVRTTCQGMRDKVSFRGTWAATSAGIELRLPALEQGHDAAPCLLARDGDEDVLRCQVDRDLAFEARPIRR
ncbi:MAG: hypothetical protein R3B06_32865 [Kofleriaceae bacterium]